MPLELFVIFAIVFKYKINSFNIGKFVSNTSRKPEAKVISLEKKNS
jgi:hypothetical protein